MKLVLFCDYGLDDAAATVDALLHAEEDGYQKIDLVAVAGNVPKEVALRNAKKLVANLKFEFPETTIVDTTACPQPERFLQNIHGNDGMGDLLEETTFAGRVIPFAQWLNEEGDFDLVSLGPMTLVPDALKTGRVKKFVFMGGNVAEKPNFGEYEFNHGMNAEAFAYCAKFPHIAVTMDTCRNPIFNVQKTGVAGKGLLPALVNRSRELTFQTGERGCYIWDDIAVKVLRHPEWFLTERKTDAFGNVLSVAKYVFGKSYEEILPL